VITRGQMLARSAAVLAAAEWFASGEFASGEFASAASHAAAASPAEVQMALVETILPIGDPSFPHLSAADVAQRMDALFGLARNPSYAASLAAFDRIGAAAPSALADVSAPPAGKTEGTRLEGDDARFRRWSAAANPKHFTSFVRLDIAARSSYFDLYLRSASLARRRFYTSSRALVLAVAYSTPELWSAIGYPGPFRQPAS
jgi:hypothetical protein